MIKRKYVIVSVGTINNCIIMCHVCSFSSEVRASFWHQFAPVSSHSPNSALVLIIHPAVLLCTSMSSHFQNSQTDSSSVLPCLVGLFVCPNLPAIFASEDLNSMATIMCSISVWSQGSGGFNEECGCTIRPYSNTVLQNFHCSLKYRDNQSFCLTDTTPAIQIISPYLSAQTTELCFQNREKDFLIFQHPSCAQQEHTGVTTHTDALRLLSHKVYLSQPKLICPPSL